jgi:hypothetical protein
MDWRHADTVVVVVVVEESGAPIRSIGYLRVLYTSVYQLPETLVHSTFSPLL